MWEGGLHECGTISTSSSGAMLLNEMVQLDENLWISTSSFYANVAKYPCSLLRHHWKATN